jgi:ASCH domain
MKALTVKEPYAALIIAGVKKIENRKWYTDYRGPVAIHAGLGDVPDMEWEQVRDKLYELAVGDPAWIDSFLTVACDPGQHGVVLGTVDLVDVRKLPLPGPWGIYGVFHWMLANPVQFDKPIPARGALGLWEWAG